MCVFACAQVKAAKFGHILVVDEADKAPTNVTCILKTLVESKEMILADGRRIISGTHTLWQDLNHIWACFRYRLSIELEFENKKCIQLY